GKLEIKKTVESGQVRQSFSHGRSKMVAVEVRRKRTYAPDAGGAMAEVKEDATGAADAVAAAFPSGAGDRMEADPAARQGAAVSLTTEEKAARARALEDSRKVGVALRGQTAFPPFVGFPDQAKPPLAPEGTADVGGAAEEGLRREADAEDAGRQAEEEARKQAEEEARRREEQAMASASAAAAKLAAREEAEGDRDQRGRGKGPFRSDARRPTLAPHRREARRRSGRVLVDEVTGEREERTRSLASVRRAREKQRLQQSQLEEIKIIRDVVIPETITVQELANRMAERGTDVVKALMKMDVMASITQTIDADTAELVVSEFGHNVKRVSDADVEIGLKGDADDETNLVPRPPVVTVMGHVDHGKTSLLDALRKTDVVSQEAGGITQHIGAYQVTLNSGATITFIDTPGHAAFTAMRARGAKVTDIVVLVVAGDDGIMPQTIEAMNHARAANVPMIVAINKIDKPGADPGRVRTELLQHDVLVEEMGGENLSVEVSAKERTNLDKLEEDILLQAELLDLKANPDRPAEGVVVEARMERGRGSLATILIQRGTLRVGDIFVAGGEWGRARALIDARGDSIEEAGPSMPVEVLGLSGTPAAGDDVNVVDSEARARQITEFRQRREREAKAAASTRWSVEQMFARAAAGGTRELPIVVKADADGSAEAVVGALDRLGTDEVRTLTLHSGVGGINESDVTLARASQALIIGFNVRADAQARE
ncbi:MAG: translation initiation factor IF-2, partial [Alphaproteobacteria bacterium]